MKRSSGILLCAGGAYLMWQGVGILLAEQPVRGLPSLIVGFIIITISMYEMTLTGLEDAVTISTIYRHGYYITSIRGGVSWIKTTAREAMDTHNGAVEDARKDFIARYRREV